MNYNNIFVGYFSSIFVLQDENSTYPVLRSPAWIHSDVMDDNIHFDRDGGENVKWRPAHILDFSDLSIGESSPLFTSGIHWL